MSDQAMMEKLLVVLNKIEERLATFEAEKNVAEVKGKGTLTVQEPTVDEDSSFNDESLAKSKAEHTVAETPQELAVEDSSSYISSNNLRIRAMSKLSSSDSFSIGSSNHKRRAMDDEEIRLSGNQAYRESEKRRQIYMYDVARDVEDYQSFVEDPLLQGNGPPPHDLWTKYLGHTWRIPPDGRVLLSFAEYELCKVKNNDQLRRLTILKDWNSGMGKGCFKILDFDDKNKEMEYNLPMDFQGPLYHEASLEERFAEAERSHYTPYNFSNCHPKSDTESKLPLNPTVACWRRYISLIGLTSCTYDAYKRSSCASEADSFDLIEKTLPVFGRLERDAVHQLLYILINNHVQGTFGNPQVSAWASIFNHSQMTFHILTYTVLDKERMLNDPFEKDLSPDETSAYLNNEKWPHGHLYDKSTPIFKVAYSTYISSGSGKMTVKAGGYTRADYRVPGPDYWTIVDLQPRFTPTHPTDSEFDLDIENWNEFSWPGRAGETFMKLVYTSLLKALVSWNELLTYFDNLFEEKEVFLRPSDHDSLLVDDEAFTRSRKYFWALSCLTEFEKCITDNIHQWGASRTIWDRELPEFDPAGWEDVQYQFKKIEVVVERLRVCQNRFKEHRENVSALRDGLFNASSVMESRAANQLGENVKLLTFVSIFFLPLAFTTSIWGMSTDLLSVTTLAYVMVIISLMTYLAVFNLNSLVGLSRLAYTSQRSKFISMMKDNESETWKSRGERFDGFNFKPRSMAVMPSEWLIPLFVLSLVRKTLVKPVQYLGNIRPSRKKREKTSVASENA